jgi:hypothetical protein
MAKIKAKSARAPKRVDLPPLRTGVAVPPAALAQFRRDVAELQRRGLLPGARVKASVARPLQVREGHHLAEYVRAYKDVLTGHAAAVELPRAAVIEQHKMGRKTVRGTGSIGGRVLIPKAPDERVTVTKTGAVIRTDIPSGLQVIDIPGRFLSKRELDRAVKAAGEMGGSRKYWGYKMSDHHSTKYFTSPRMMLQYLRGHYKAQIAKLGWNKFRGILSILSSNNPDDLAKEKGKAR